MSGTLSSFGLSLLDIVFSLCVVGPAVVGYWRGTWFLSDHYITPTNALLSGWISLSIGWFLHLVFMLFQRFIRHYVHPDKCGFLCFAVLSRLYTGVYSFGCVNTWRGVWHTLEHYTGTELHALLITTTLAVLALAGLKTLRNITAPPFAIVMDLQDGYFTFPSMFRVRAASKDLSYYILDCVFSVFFIGSTVVIVWRGTWGILDQILFPNDLATSSWVSLVIGYGVSVVGFALQRPARIACDKLSGTLRLIVADVYMFFCFLGTVNIWRGIWYLLNIYLLPDNPLVSFWLTHCSCLLILMVLCCSNSLLVRGVYKDGEEEGGQCVVFACNYFRYRYKYLGKVNQQSTPTSAAQATLLNSEKRKSDVSTNDNNVRVNLMSPIRDTLL